MTPSKSDDNYEKPAIYVKPKHPEVEVRASRSPSQRKAAAKRSGKSPNGGSKSPKR